MPAFLLGSRLAVLAGLLAVSVAATAQTPSALPPGGSALPRDELAAPGSAMDSTSGGMLPGSDPFILLVSNTQVQADLGLTAEQVRHLEDTGVLFRTQLSELTRSTAPSAKAEMDRQKSLGRGAIARVLSPDQLLRLREVLLQIYGPCLLLDESDLMRELRLSAEQSEQLRGGCHGLAAEIQGLFVQSGPGQDQCAVVLENRMVIQETRANANQRLVELLSAEQQQVLQRLQGRHFELQVPLPAVCNR